MTDKDETGIDASSTNRATRSFLRTPPGLALCVFLAVAGVLLWAEHRAHILGALPLLLPLLLCAGMHLFMHRGRGGHRGHGGERDAR